MPIELGPNCLDAKGMPPLYCPHLQNLLHAQDPLMPFSRPPNICSWHWFLWVLSLLIFLLDGKWVPIRFCDKTRKAICQILWIQGIWVQGEFNRSFGIHCWNWFEDCKVPTPGVQWDATDFLKSQNLNEHELSAGPTCHLLVAFSLCSKLNQQLSNDLQCWGVLIKEWAK